MDNSSICKIYKLMEDVHKILTANKIPYWADGGTLLGAIRHKGFIKWDDDLDIDIENRSLNSFLKLKKIFKSHGYGLFKIWFGYKIFDLKGKPFKNRGYNFPFLDVFIMEHKNGKMYYKPRSWGKRGKDYMHYKVSELFPLKLCKFGKIKIYRANKPTPFLNALYGKNWLSVANPYNHISKENERILTELDKEAAICKN